MKVVMGDQVSCQQALVLCSCARAYVHVRWMEEDQRVSLRVADRYGSPRTAIIALFCVGLRA